MSAFNAENQFPLFRNALLVNRFVWPGPDLRPLGATSWNFGYAPGSLLQRLRERIAARRRIAHGLKYSLFYGRPGVRLVGYDNERGKGDHRHFEGAETPYVFSTVERLIEDFWADVEALRGER